MTKWQLRFSETAAKCRNGYFSSEQFAVELRSYSRLRCLYRYSILSPKSQLGLRILMWRCTIAYILNKRTNKFNNDMMVHTNNQDFTNLNVGQLEHGGFSFIFRIPLQFNLKPYMGRVFAGISRSNVVHQRGGAVCIVKYYRLRTRCFRSLMDGNRRRI